MARKIPEWVGTHANECCKALGIDDSGITMYYRIKKCGKNENGDSHMGYCDSVPRYSYAKIQLAPQVTDDDTGYETLTHEHVHAAVGEWMLACNQLIDLLPEGLQKHGRDLYEEAMEKCVTRIGKGLAVYLRGQHGTPESTTGQGDQAE